MRTFMIIGGLAGFAVGIGFGAPQRGDWPTVFWKACLAAYLGGLLMRWWARIWIQNLLEVRRMKPVEQAEQISPESNTEKEPS